ncbi:MAG: dUTP diphosphatase [Desulfobacterota bacterium]|nr:dUTP diphosphatase [Thermodesulfobacteriota bacterium]MDW8001925.1 dUTP diphosphatase [Deltaproteobacteria bacterium]
MAKLEIRFSKRPEAKTPIYGTPSSSGLDLFSCLEEPIVIEPKKWAVIPTGIRLAIPEGYEGEIRPRSGLALKYGVTVLNSPGTIDSDYRGELKVILINHGESPFYVENGMRIAQLVIRKVERVELVEDRSLPETDRGEGGFGSTGIK